MEKLQSADFDKRELLLHEVAALPEELRTQKLEELDIITASDENLEPNLEFALVGMTVKIEEALKILKRLRIHLTPGTDSERDVVAIDNEKSVNFQYDPQEALAKLTAVSEEIFFDVAALELANLPAVKSELFPYEFHGKKGRIEKPADGFVEFKSRFMRGILVARTRGKLAVLLGGQLMASLGTQAKYMNSMGEHPLSSDFKMVMHNVMESAQEMVNGHAALKRKQAGAVESRLGETLGIEEDHSDDVFEKASASIEGFYGAVLNPALPLKVGTVGNLQDREKLVMDINAKSLYFMDLFLKLQKRLLGVRGLKYSHLQAARPGQMFWHETQMEIGRLEERSGHEIQNSVAKTVAFYSTPANIITVLDHLIEIIDSSAEFELRKSERLGIDAHNTADYRALALVEFFYKCKNPAVVRHAWEYLKQRPELLTDYVLESIRDMKKDPGGIAGEAMAVLVSRKDA